MNVLVVGATAWLAGHLIPRLIADGHIVFAAGHDPARLTTLQGTTPIVWDLAAPHVPGHLPTHGTTSLRLSAPYGPRQTGRLIPGLINRVRTGQPATLKEGRGPRFNPLYVDHVVDVIAQALAADGHHLLNAGGDEALSVRD